MCDSPRTGCAWGTTPFICMERTSNNRVIMACELYCCLLPQCEALRICRSGYPIATKWCCDQDVKVVRSSAFTQRTSDRCVRCKKEGMLLQPLRWCCVECVIHHERDVREEQHHSYMWREQEIIEWSWHVNSIVACCHSAKLCAHAARDFRSQQFQPSVLSYNGVISSTWVCCYPITRQIIFQFYRNQWGEGLFFAEAFQSLVLQCGSNKTLHNSIH